MKAILSVKCDACETKLGAVAYDTADMPEQVKKLLDYLVLNHREYCPYYRTSKSFED